MDGLARQLPYLVETGMSVTVAKAEPDSDDVGEDGGEGGSDEGNAEYSVGEGGGGQHDDSGKGDCKGGGSEGDGEDDGGGEHCVGEGGGAVQLGVHQPGVAVRYQLLECLDVEDGRPQY